MSNYKHSEDKAINYLFYLKSLLTEMENMWIKYVMKESSKAESWPGLKGEISTWIKPSKNTGNCLELYHLLNKAGIFVPTTGIDLY